MSRVGGINVQTEHVARKVAGYCAAALLLGWLCGCGGGSEPYVVPLTAAENQLKFIAMAYNDCHSREGHGPKDAEELKKYLKEFGNPDELLVSANDKQPFVIIWGKNPAGGPTDYKGMFPILAYESKGSGGARAVTDVRGRPMTVPDEDFPKLKFVGGHVPAIN
jgi:hypothetical protein